VGLPSSSPEIYANNMGFWDETRILQTHMKKDIVCEKLNDMHWMEVMTFLPMI